MPLSTRKAEFAVKGVFRITNRFGNGRRGHESAFEQRIIVIKAMDERQARRLSHERFSKDEWNAAWPAPDISRQSNSYLGIARVLKLGGEMDPGEVWYEFSESCPAIEQRPPAKRGRGSGSKARGTRGR